MISQLELIHSESSHENGKELSVRELAKVLDLSASMTHRYLERGMPPFADQAIKWREQNTRRGPITYSQLGRLFGVSRQMAFKYVCKGCPTTTIEEAKKWHETGIRKKRSDGSDRYTLPASSLGAEKKWAEGYVYLLLEEDSRFVKIGFSQNQPFCRTKTCQTGNPRKLFLAHFRKHKHAKIIEHRLHCAFKTHHKNGEWFDVPIWKVLEELDRFNGWIGWAGEGGIKQEVAA